MSVRFGYFSDHYRKNKTKLPFPRYVRYSI